MSRTRQEVNDAAIQRKVLELIEAILVNKFLNLSREEIKQILALELIRGTRVYEELKEEARQEVRQEVTQELQQQVRQEVTQELQQQVRQEVKLEMTAKLLQRGMSVQEVAEILELDMEVMRKIVGE